MGQKIRITQLAKIRIQKCGNKCSARQNENKPSTGVINGLSSSPLNCNVFR